MYTHLLTLFQPNQLKAFHFYPQETKFEIFLEDAAGKALGQFSAKHKPLEKKLHEIAIQIPWRFLRVLFGGCWQVLIRLSN